MKFKVGDKVRVRTVEEMLANGGKRAYVDIHFGRNEGIEDIYFIQAMRDLCNQVYEVVLVNEDRAYYLLSELEETQGWWFIDEMLEPVTTWEDIEKTRKGKADPINPAHYQQFSVETIDMMVRIWGKEAVGMHCEITAFKYALRMGFKDPLEQDAKKRDWYLAKAAELRGKNEQG
jgi:hypothetical protein